MALASDVQLRDGTVSVTGDSALQFGVVLRYQDVDNYLRSEHGWGEAT